VSNKNGASTPRYFVLMSLTHASDRSMSSVYSALELARLAGGRLVLFDKTSNGEAEKLDQVVAVDVIVEDLSLGLLQSICRWVAANRGALESPESTTVQVVAEDDWFGVVGEQFSVDLPQLTMAIPRIVFETGDAVNSPLVSPAPIVIRAQDSAKTFRHLGAFADGSWHACTRGDVFVDYFTWLGSLPMVLPHHSSGMVWLALCRGDVGALKNFVYYKEYSSRVNQQQVNLRYADFYQKAGLLGVDLECDPTLFSLGLISLLFEERSRNPSVNVEFCISAAIDLYSASLGWAVRRFGIGGFVRIGSIGLLASWTRSRFLLRVSPKRSFSGTESFAVHNDRRWQRLWLKSQKLLPKSTLPLSYWYSRSFPQ